VLKYLVQSIVNGMS